MKLKKITTLLSSLILVALSGVAVACRPDGTGSSDDRIDSAVYSEGVTVGGENIGEENSTYSVENAEDIHVRKNGDISAYVAKVVAVQGNDVKAVTVDDSKVDLTKSGRYSLTYSYGTAKKEVSVFVYETPVIADGKAQQTVSTTYANAYQDIFDGITASVVCGEETLPLDVKLETQDFIREDGSIDISQPTRTLTFIAEAPSGEVVKLTRNVTVTGGMVAPTLATAYTYDVCDDSLTITGVEQESIDHFLTVSIDEKTISPLVKIEEGNIVIEGQGLYELLGVSEAHTLRVVTSNGYAEASLKVVDEKPVSLDVSEVKAFIATGKVNGETYGLPAAKIANERQSAEISFRLLKKNEEIVNKVQSFTFDGIGTYTLEYTVRGVTSRFDFVCYNDLGLQGSVMFTPEKKFDFELAEGCELMRYTVREKNGIVAYYSVNSEEYDDLNAFYQTVAGLNKSKVYLLEVYAKKGASILSQTVDFTVGDDRITEVLTGKNSLDLGRVTTHSYCALEYSVSTLGERMGAFRWHFPTENMGQTESDLHYGDEIAKTMTAGKFVTFDVYCTSALNLSWYDDGNVTSFYSSGYKWEYSPKIAYYVDGVRYTDLRDMNAIPGGYLNKWVTIELELTRDFAGDASSEKFNNTWNGLFVIGNYANLREYNNYVANMKISSYSFMQDNTINEVFEPNKESEGVGEDIWQD